MERYDCSFVTADLFSAVGVAPALGRDFRAEDEEPGAAPFVILSHDLWRTRFAADPSIVGRVVVLAGEAHQIIGVLPAGFRPIVTSGAEIWRPLRLNRAGPGGARRQPLDAPSQALVGLQIAELRLIPRPIGQARGQGVTDYQPVQGAIGQGVRQHHRKGDDS